MRISIRPMRRAGSWGGGGVFGRKLEGRHIPCYHYFDKYESISLSSSNSYMRVEIGNVTEVNFLRK